MARPTTVAVPAASTQAIGGLMPSPRLAWAVWLRNWEVFLRNAIVEAGGMVVEPLILLGAIGFGLGQFVGRMADGQSYAGFVAPGLAAGYAMWHSLYDSSYGFYLRMSTRQVIRHILETPVELQDLVLGEVVWNATRGAVATAAVLVLAAALGLVSSPWAVLAVPTGFLMGLVFASIGLCCAAVAPSINSLNIVFNLFATPLFFFGGVFFPITTLPEGVRTLVWTLPLTQGVYLMRGFASGQVGPLHAAAAAALVVTAAVAGYLAFLLLRRRLVK